MAGTVALPYYVPLVSDLYPMQEAFADTATAHGTHCFRTCYAGTEGQGDTGRQGAEKQVRLSFAMMTYLEGSLFHIDATCVQRSNDRRF